MGFLLTSWRGSEKLDQEYLHHLLPTGAGLFVVRPKEYRHQAQPTLNTWPRTQYSIIDYGLARRSLLVHSSCNPPSICSNDSVISHMPTCVLVYLFTYPTFNHSANQPNIPSTHPASSTSPAHHSPLFRSAH